MVTYDSVPNVCSVFKSPNIEHVTECIMYGLDGLFWCALNSSRFFKAVKMPHKWKIIKVNKKNGLTWNCACSTQSNTNQSLNHYKSLEHASSAQNQMVNVQRQYTHKESHSTVYTITIAYNISESHKSQIQKKTIFFLVLARNVFF